MTTRYVVGLGSLGEYDAAVEWAVYESEILNYLAANLIDVADRRRAVLLSAIGAKALKTLRNLCSPDKPETRPYDELIEILGTFYGKKSTISVERTKFIRRLQSDDETIDQFCEKLRELALTCEYGNQLEERLKDQLIAGCKSEPIRKRLYENEKKTFQECTQLARNLELIEKDLKKATEKMQVHTVKSQFKNSSYSQRRLNRGGCYNSYNGRSRGRFQSWGGVAFRGYANPRAGTTYNNNNGGACFRCGKMGHFGRNCSYISMKCNLCNKVGHKATVCRIKNNETLRISSSTKGVYRDEAVVNLDEHHEKTEAEHGGFSEEFTVRKINTIAMPSNKPIIVQVEINRVALQMEFDTGSQFSLIPKNSLKKIDGPHLTDGPKLLAHWVSGNRKR